MHPYKICCKNPSEDKHIDSSKYEAAKANPSKAGQSFKKSVMKFYTRRTSKRKEPT